MQAQIPGAGSPAVHEVDYIQSVLMPDAAQKAKALWGIGVIVFGWLSISLEVLLRREFGTRYLSVLRLFFAYWAVSFFLVVTGVLNGRLTYFVANPLGYIQLTLQHPFILLFLFFCGYHRARIWRRQRQGIRYHTMSFGISRIGDLAQRLNIRHPLLSDDWLTYRFTEPALCLAASFFVVRTDYLLGNFLFLASASLFIKNQLLFSYQQNRVWDLQDVALETEFYNAAVRGAPKTETAGLSLVKGYPDKPVAAQPVNAAPVAVQETTINAADAPRKRRGKADFAATVGDALAGKQNTPDADNIDQNGHN